MDAEHFEKHAKASENTKDKAPSRPPPLAPHAGIVRPIAVVSPVSEVNSPLFSSVTWRSLLDGILLDASILETLISGVPLTEDSDSEVELEQLKSDSDPEVGEWIVIDDDDEDDNDDDEDDNDDDDGDNDDDEDDNDDDAKADDDDGDDNDEDADAAKADADDNADEANDEEDDEGDDDDEDDDDDNGDEM